MTSQADLLQLLTAAQSPLRREAAELLLAHLLERPVGRFFDADELATLLAAALSRENLERALARHLLPAVTRVRAALQQADEQVQDALPEAVVAELRALSTQPEGPRFAWMRGALDREKLRELVAPALQELLLQVIQNITPGGQVGSAAGRLTGRLGRGVTRSTERLLSVGKSVAGGLGVDLEGRIKEAASNAVGGLQAALGARLSSPEGKALTGALAEGVLQHVLAVRSHVILDDLDRLPLERALRLAPPTLAHTFSRELGRVCLHNELQAFLELEGERSLGELLAESGLLETVRPLALAKIEESARDLFASPAFGAWLERLLDTAS